MVFCKKENDTGADGSGITTNANTHAKMCYSENETKHDLRKYLGDKGVCNLGHSPNYSKYYTSYYTGKTDFTEEQKKLNSTPCTGMLGLTWEKKNPKCKKNCKGDNYITCGTLPNCTGKVYYDSDKKVGAKVMFEIYDKGIKISKPGWLDGDD